MHGGKSLAGIASPLLTTGRYSRHVPTRLAAKYEESQSDPDLLNLRAEIALLDARLADQLEQVSNGESGELWASLKKAWQTFKVTSDPVEKAEALANIDWLINEGFQDYLAWQDIRATIEQRRKNVDSERGRLKDMQQLISVERGMMLVGALTASIRRHVTDRNTLAAIAADLRGIVASGDGGQPLTS